MFCSMKLARELEYGMEGGGGGRTMLVASEESPLPLATTPLYTPDAFACHQSKYRFGTGWQVFISTTWMSA